MSTSIFGIHKTAIQAGSARINQISKNIANIDTPGYKAKDYEFKSLMNQHSSQDRLTTTHPDHISTNNIESNLQFRTPLTPRPDQNTVDEDLEKAAFQEASSHYQATLGFIDAKAKTLKSAIKGH